MWKFLGQGLNPCPSCNQSHSSDNTGSLTHWATREPPSSFISFKITLNSTIGRKCYFVLIYSFGLLVKVISIFVYLHMYIYFSEFLFYIFFFFLSIFRASPVVDWSFWARGWIIAAAAAASLCHSHTDLSCVCDLHHSSWQCQILNTLNEARDSTCILIDTCLVSGL